MLISRCEGINPGAGYFWARPVGSHERVDRLDGSPSSLLRPSKGGVMRHYHAGRTVIWRPGGILWSYKRDGFDSTCEPPWYMVPLGGTRVVKLLDRRLSPYLHGTGGIDLLSDRLRTFQLIGRRLGQLRLFALDEQQDCHGELDLSVRARKQYRVAFHFVREVDPNTKAVITKTGRKKRDIKKLLADVNEIYTPQINVEFVEASDGKPDEIDIRGHRKDAHFETMLLQAAARFERENTFGTNDPQALVVVLFVANWPGETAGGNVPGTNLCFIEDSAGGHTVAHEIGHALIGDRGSAIGYVNDHSTDSHDLMYDRHTEDTDAHPSPFEQLLRRGEADLLNDSDLKSLSG